MHELARLPRFDASPCAHARGCDDCSRRSVDGILRFGQRIRGRDAAVAPVVAFSAACYSASPRRRGPGPCGPGPRRQRGTARRRFRRRCAATTRQRRTPLAGRAAVARASVSVPPPSPTYPQYDGNCVACTGPGYYCPTAQTCWVLSADCNNNCAGTTCYSGPSQCSATPSPSSGTLPQYNGNCIACTGPGYYCPGNATCWSQYAQCNSNCAITCYGSTSQCPATAAPGTGTLPQYDGNCVACTGPGSYCPPAATCFHTSSGCSVHCASSCYSAGAVLRLPRLLLPGQRHVLDGVRPVQQHVRDDLLQRQDVGPVDAAERWHAWCRAACCARVKKLLLLRAQ